MTRQKMIRLLNDFERHVRKHEMMGSYPPDEAEIIKRDYNKSKSKLRNEIDNLITKAERNDPDNIPFG